LQDKISKIKKQITYITNLGELNVFLYKEFQKLFKTDYIKIVLFDKDKQNIEIKEYFSKNT
jgi:hypothetical protein